MDSVVRKVQQLEGCKGKLPLIVVHHKRTKGPAAMQPFAQQCLNKWRAANAFYTTPTGANDDWYAAGMPLVW